MDALHNLNANDKKLISLAVIALLLQVIMNLIEYYKFSEIIYIADYKNQKCPSDRFGGGGDLK